MPFTKVIRVLPIGAAASLFLGQHGSEYQINVAGSTPATTNIGTSVTGSTILQLSAGELSKMAVPTDNKSNTYTQLQSSGYAGGLYPGFGFEVHGKANIAGGANHTVSFVKSAPTDQESTIIAVEVRGGATIQSSSIVARAGAGAGVPLTSSSVTTTGPAFLVSFWGGDSDVFENPKDAAPPTGWTLHDQLFLDNTAYVQAAAASKYIGAAGTYTIDWTPTRNQGCIIFLAAVQV